MSFFSRLNPTLRGLLILAAIAGIVVALRLEQALTVALILAKVAFILAIALFVYMIWREQREGIAAWPARARLVFYGGAVLAVADIGVYWYGGASGYEILAFVAVLACSLFAMWRTWRDQHTYS
jgi:small-conductance mechanosensitive channel